MADWSQLPKELLHLISQKLDSPFYLLRFRSVCSSWRSSTPKNHHHHLNLPSKFPTPSNANNIDSKPNKVSTFPLSKRTLFLITPPLDQTLTLNPWLIKIGPDSRGKTRLWHPLSRDTQLPLHFPSVIDFNHLETIDLGVEFVIGNFPSASSSLNPNSIYMEKVVVFDAFEAFGDADTWCNEKGRGKDGCYVLLTIHVSGKLAIFRCGDERWTIIPEMPTPFEDVCVFKGRPIAVDGAGRAVAVGGDLGLELVAEGLFWGDKKILVESEGELLLVDKYLSCVGYESFVGENNDSDDDDDDVDDDDDDEDDDDDDGGGGGGGGGGEFDRIGMEMAGRFDVFRLDEKEKRWVEERDLDDRVLFLGEDCAFSTRVFDLGTGDGNCVIFRDDAFQNIHSNELGMAVYHMDQRLITPLSDFPCFSKLFWPPPEWVGLR